MKRGSKHTVTLPQNQKFIDFGMHNSWRKGPQNVPIFVGTFPPGVISKKPKILETIFDEQVSCHIKAGV